MQEIAAPTEDRRDPGHTAEDKFSPEYLAVLVVCGGTVRDSDWAVLPEAIAARRVGAQPDITRAKTASALAPK